MVALAKSRLFNQPCQTRVGKKLILENHYRNFWEFDFATLKILHIQNSQYGVQIHCNFSLYTKMDVEQKRDVELKGRANSVVVEYFYYNATPKALPTRNMVEVTRTQPPFASPFTPLTSLRVVTIRRARARERVLLGAIPNGGSRRDRPAATS